MNTSIIALSVFVESGLNRRVAHSCGGTMDPNNIAEYCSKPSRHTGVAAQLMSLDPVLIASTPSIMKLSPGNHSGFR